jgi:hypothetical protein
MGVEGKTPVYGLSRCINSGPLTDSSESTISRASAILQNGASPDYAESDAVNSLINRL